MEQRESEFTTNIFSLFLVEISEKYSAINQLFEVGDCFSVHWNKTFLK